MTYQQLEKANHLKFTIDDLTRQIERVDDARGHILVIKAIGTPVEITIPEEMRGLILDMLEGRFVRERCDKDDELDAM